MEGVTAKATAGKVYNPFRWKIGKDYLLWDSGITPEGIAGMFPYAVDERWNLFLNTGYFILDENSRNPDPHMLGVQGGVHGDLTEEWRVGARASSYSWRSLNSSFFDRSERFGNIEDGLVRGARTISASDFNIVEVSAYVGYDASEAWPVLLYGHFVKNFDAFPSDLFPAAGRKDTGWGVGGEMSSKKKYVALGLGYYHLEANYWPAQFMHADLTDGLTNRTGWTVYGTRQVLPNADLTVTLFWSEPIPKSLPAFARSVANAQRIRLQTDINVRF